MVYSIIIDYNLNFFYMQNENKSEKVLNMKFFPCCHITIESPVLVIPGIFKKVLEKFVKIFYWVG